MKNKEQEIHNALDGIVLPTNYLIEYENTEKLRKDILKKLNDEKEKATGNKKKELEKKIKDLEDSLRNDLIKSVQSLDFSYLLKNKAGYNLSNVFNITTPVGDAVIKNKEVNINVKKKGKLKGSSLAKLAANASGNSAKVTKWNLYNSGFWISMDPMSSDDKIKLNARIASEIIEVGIDTMGMIFSNDQAAYRSILLDFLKPFINIGKSSLRFEEGDDPYDYISALDSDILIAALVYNLYPRGFDIYSVCANNIDLDENGTKCNYVIEGTANAIDCIYADKDSLTYEQLSILSMGVGSVYKGTEEEYVNDDSIGHSLLDYKEHIDNNYVLEYKTGEFGILDDIKISIGDTTINDMLKSSDKYIVELKTQIDEAVIMLSNEDDKEVLIEEFVDSILINKYTHFINRIDIGEHYTDDMYDIFDTLNGLCENTDLAIDIVNKISEWINKSSMSIVGHQRYICSHCKEIVSKDSSVSKKSFESIVPYNILQVFTALRIMS